MDKKKIRNIIIAFVVFVFLIGTLCGFGNYGKYYNNYYYKNPCSYSGSDIYVYIDPETGVNYLVFHDKKGSSICPRFNTDLTLYASKPDKK